MNQLNFINHQQLSSFYVGCELLQNQKRISFDFNFGNVKDTLSPILYGMFGSSSFAIDCMDGYNWIRGSQSENLIYFKENVNVDFLFKRNYDHLIVDLIPKIKVLPFGFNSPLGLKYPSGLSLLKNFSKNPYWAIRYCRLLSGYYDYRTFECSSVQSTPMRILYQVRLWDPSSTQDVHNKSARTQMNQFRIDCVRLLKSSFAKYCIAGVEDSHLSREICPDLIISAEETSRKNYFKLIRNTSIGVTTNGLHNSIGWKMAEYIAASRAIVCEKPYFLFPSHFIKGQNYESFTTTEELGVILEHMLSKPKVTNDMMRENQDYYETYQRPDRLVWNILNQIK